jgi:hypothetical protein
MATTTPNFGWSVPTSSDLVKNGATAIETLGDSIDASLVDLKGGTTGQVLAKATNTDMDFTWTTSSAASFVGCSLYKSADQSIANATTTVITWDSESYDTNSFHDNATNNSRITIPAGKAGKYLIQLQLNWGTNATSYREARVRLNGSTLLAYVQAQAAAAGGTANTLTTVKTLAVADYIEIQGEQASGGALAATGVNAYATQVQVTYLGA